MLYKLSAFTTILKSVFLVKYQWNSVMRKEMCEMKTWEAFSKTYSKDNASQFWVAVEKPIGHVVGTVSVVVFENYKMVKGCGLELGFDDSVTIDSAPMQRHISFELKVRFLGLTFTYFRSKYIITLNKLFSFCGITIEKLNLLFNHFFILHNGYDML